MWGINMRRPDFIIIGAMKCATSTLHDQLAMQDGIFMSTPKEPCYFSDDEIYAKGREWYEGLFGDAGEGVLCGESSTHYTKRPRLGKTIERMVDYFGEDSHVKFVYVVRHPIDRLVSHYIHDWTENKITVGIEEAVEGYADLVDFSLYGMQLTGFIEAFGRERILLVPFDGIRERPGVELARMCRFVGYGGEVKWYEEEGAKNVSSARLRKSGLRDAIVFNPVVSAVRRVLVPQSVRDKVKSMWQIKDRPELSAETVKRLEARFDEDLGVLSKWLGRRICCGNFREATLEGMLDWKCDCDEASNAGAVML